MLVAYFTFSAFDANHNPIIIPHLLIENKEQARYFEEAEKRHHIRQQMYYQP